MRRGETVRTQETDTARTNGTSQTDAAPADGPGPLSIASSVRNGAGGGSRTAKIRSARTNSMSEDHAVNILDMLYRMEARETVPEMGERDRPGCVTIVHEWKAHDDGIRTLQVNYIHYVIIGCTDC